MSGVPSRLIDSEPVQMAEIDFGQPKRFGIGRTGSERISTASSWCGRARRWRPRSQHHGSAPRVRRRRGPPSEDGGARPTLCSWTAISTVSPPSISNSSSWVADAGARRHWRPNTAFSLWRMHVEGGDGAPMRVAAADDHQDGEQQHVGQLVRLALCPARIGNLLQNVQQRRERRHGNLQPDCRQESDMRRRGKPPRCPLPRVEHRAL